MSPRKNNTITIHAWPKWQADKLYKGRVKSTHVERASGCLRVVVEHFGGGQSGRVCEIALPPARPGNRTSAFLSACGIDADTPGTTVCLDQITGATIGLRFRGSDADGTENFDFERIPDASADASKKSREPTDLGLD